MGSIVWAGSIKKTNIVKKKRQEKDLSQLKLAEESGVARSTISKVENLKVSPRSITCEKLALALVCTVEELFPREVVEDE